MYYTIYGYYSSLRLWGLICKKSILLVNPFFSETVIFVLVNYLEIGITNRLLLDRLLSSDDITDADIRLFYNGVGLLYETTWLEYALKRLSINNPFLKNAQVIDFDARSNDSVTMIVSLTGKSNFSR